MAAARPPARRPGEGEKIQPTVSPEEELKKLVETIHKTIEEMRKDLNESLKKLQEELKKTQTTGGKA